MPVLPPAQPPDVDLPPQPDDVPWPTSRWPEADTDTAPDIGTGQDAGTGQDTGKGQEAGALGGLLDEAFPTDEHDDRTDSTDRFGLPLAFLAVRGGRIVAERYGPTAGPDEKLISWSMAKSIAHALVGVLVAEDRLDVQAPAPVPEWSAPHDPRRGITLDQLLRMVPGTRFNEDYVDSETSHCIDMLFGEGAADMAAYTAALPADDEPDTVFNYSSGTTNVVCRILADQVGRGPEFERWARRVLFDPLGMDPELTFDDAGTWVGSSFLHCSARDFARFGLLYLRNGVWDGNRILPEGWVDYARTPRAVDPDGGRYGAHWWIWRPDHRVFHASGYETQRVIVDPANDLVLVRLGKTPIELADNVDDWLERVRLTLAEP